MNDYAYINITPNVFINIYYYVYLDKHTYTTSLQWSQPSYKPVFLPHDGTHHADEVMGCAILHSINPEWSINRSHQLDQILPYHIVIDIGMKYDAQELYFDHHQDKELPAANVLVWNHFGLQSIAAVLERYNIRETDEAIYQKVHQKVLDRLLTKISDIDRGIVVGAEDSFNSIVRSFNMFADGFEKALTVSLITLEAAVLAAYKAIGDEDKYFALEKFGALWISKESSPLFNWKELAEQEGVLVLISPSNRGGWQVVSRDTAILELPAHSTARFRHSSGFLIAFETYTDALNYGMVVVEEINLPGRDQ